VGVLIAFALGVFVGALVIVIWALCAEKKTGGEDDETT
jgi:hypothetical protein